MYINILLKYVERNKNVTGVNKGGEEWGVGNFFLSHNINKLIRKNPIE